MNRVRRASSRPFAAEIFHPVPQLPTELLDRIVSLILLTRFPLIRDDFRSIASFSLASLRFRKIALRRYFSDVRLWNGAHWQLLVAQGENALLWVRTLRVQAETLALAPVRLSSLAHLRSLSLDCSHAGPVTQPPLMRKIFKHVQPHPALNSGLYRLTSLKLTALPYIDKALLTLIAKNLTTLTTLYLSCTDRLDLTCCWGCLEDSATSSVGMFPIPDMFSDVFLLATTFARALKPLTSLSHLHLGVFLCDEVLFYSHLVHADVCDFDTGEPTCPYGPGECPICCLSNAVHVVREREIEATKIMTKRLGNLETISWSSFFKKEDSVAGALLAYL